MFEISSSQPNAYFKKIALDTVHGGNGPTASKFVYATEQDFLDDTDLLNPFAGRIAQLTSLNGVASNVTLPFDTYRALWVRDTFTPGGNGDLKTLTNEYTQGDSSRVPGPLPLMGAGVALGFSRKLRRRITSTATKV